MSVGIAVRASRRAIDDHPRRVAVGSAGPVPSATTELVAVGTVASMAVASSR